MHPEIENLINMALADGEVTEKERGIILRKAEALGIDRDEVEMILDGKFALLTKEQSSNQTIKKSNKEGDLKKCPSCGAPVQSFISKCGECGHEFRNTEASKAISEFFNALNQFEANQKDSFDTANPLKAIGNQLSKQIGSSFGPNKSQKMKMELIRNFPIPNNKEDLFEFFSLAMPNARKKINATFFINPNEKADEALRLVWIDKCDQLLIKAKLLFPQNDPHLLQLISYGKELGLGSKPSILRKIFIGQSGIKGAIIRFYLFFMIIVLVWYYLLGGSKILRKSADETKTVDSLLILDKVEDARNACFKIDNEYRRNEGFDKINIYMSELYLDKSKIDSAYFFANKIKNDNKKNEEIDKIIFSETKVLLQEKKYDDALKKTEEINNENNRIDAIKLIEDYKNNN